MRTINIRFFFILVSATLLLAGMVFGLHRLQASNIAEALLWQASQAEKDGKLERAATFLNRYLEFAREDLDQREHLGLILSDPLMATTPPKRARARFVIEQVLAKDPLRHAARRRLCELALNEKSFDIAKEHLIFLEKNQPESAEVPYLGARWHEAQAKLPQAAEHYRLALQRDALKVDAYLRLVNVLKQLDFGKEPHHAAEIDKLVVTVLEKAPHDAGILSLAAQHAQEKGDTRIALSYLQDGLKQSPNEPRLYLALANILTQTSQRAEAIEQLQAGLRAVRPTEQFDLRWNLANLLVDENRLDESRKLAQEIRETSPLSADYLNARCDMQRGRWFDAAKQFERVRPAVKNLKDLTLQIDLFLGACYEQLEEPVLQNVAFQRAVTLDPTSLAAQRGQANALWTLGQTGEALQIYQGLISRTDDPKEAAKRRLEYVRMLLMNRTNRDAQDWQKVEENLDGAEKALSRKSLEIALVRAEACYLQGQKEKAETFLLEAIKEHPDRHEPWLTMITIAADKGDLSSANLLMKKAEDRFRGNAAFRLAQIRFWGEYRPNEAAPDLERLEAEVAAFKPKEQSALLQAIVEQYYFTNHYDQAARALKRMMQLPLHAQDVRLRMQLLEVVLHQDDDQQACAILNEIKKLEGDTPSADWSFGEAMRLTQQGRNGKKDSLEKARHLITMAAAQRPNWHPILQARAEIDELQGRYDQAIANYRRALDLGNRDPLVMKQLVQLLSQAHRFDEVDELVGRMQKIYGTTDDVVRGFVHNAYQRKEYQRAEYLARQLVAKNSKSYRDHLWLGQILAAGGKSTGDAERAFRQAVALAPAHPLPWVGLVRYLVGVGQRDGARLEIENARKSLPEDIRDLAVAQCCELAGLTAEAAACYRSALKEQPASALVHRAAADFFVRMEQPTDAETLYRKILERQMPTSEQDVASARRGLAITLVKFDLPEKTAEALKLVGLKSDDKGNIPESSIAESPEDQLIQARVLGSINHHRLRLTAIGLLEGLQPKNVLQVEDQFLLARLYGQRKSDEAAVQKIRSLLRVLLINQPKSPRILAFAGYFFVQQKELGAAEPLIAKLEQVEQEQMTLPGGYGSIELRAKMLELRGLGAQAALLLTEYSEQPGASPRRRLFLADLHGRLGHFHEAIHLCEQVRELGVAHYYESIATSLAILRQYMPSEAQPTKYEQWLKERDRVEKFLRDAMRLDPKDAGIQMQMADMMELQGKYEEVEKLCRAALRSGDTNIVALNNLAWLLGQRPDQAAEGLKLIDRAIQLYGSRPELLDTRAVVQLTLGNYEASIKDLELVVNAAPTPARIFHLSRAHDRAKNAATAVSLLRQANAMGLSTSALHPMERTAYQRAMESLSERQ